MNLGSTYFSQYVRLLINPMCKGCPPSICILIGYIIPILILYRRLLFEGHIWLDFDYLLDKNSEVINVQITSSSKLSDDAVQQISSKIENKIQKIIDVETKIDSSIIGGIKLRVGNTLIDGSVSTHLQKIRDTLIQV